ncbi:MAG TPA: M15 family metallopeptidase [Candidatus Eisenbacteria bacterium]|nr:M15 family metallopeptidase [Candidatus Eisenbacteria bacterium]
MSRSLDDLDPDVRRMAVTLIEEAKRVGIELIVTQTRRTMAEQAALYAKGRTAPGPIVTYAPPGYSWHEFGRAFDVAIKRYPNDPTPGNLYDGPWQMVGNLGEQAGLEWGGRWKHPDRPHFQHTSGLTLAFMREHARRGVAPSGGVA